MATVHPLTRLKFWYGIHRMHRHANRHERRLNFFNQISWLLPNTLPAALLRTALLRRLGGEAEPGAMIKQGAYVRDTFQIRMGRDSHIGEQCFLQCDVPIEIGPRAVLGARVSILTANHDISSGHTRVGEPSRAPVRIGAGAWIAVGATILPGVTIGDGAVIAAGAVVTQDVPPHTFAAGVPAKVIRSLSTD
jgi:maltose O-acetyltransferase